MSNNRVKKIYDIFTKSPFGLLHDHMEKVHACTELVPKLIESLLSGQQDQIETLHKEITGKEHEADIIKNQIREHLPKSIFMPVSREDLLKLLHRQDNIADHCEDLSVLLSVRKTTIHESLYDDVRDFSNKVLETTNALYDVTQKMKDLMEASFSGPSAEDVLNRIDHIGHLEYETDKLKYQLVKKMFANEESMDTISHVMCLKIFDALSHIADSAESVANAFRLMISK